MNIKLQYLALLLCLAAQSCTKIIYTIHDVRQVEPQSDEALLQFCSLKKIDATDLRRVKQEVLDTHLLKHVNKHYLFDAEGQFVDYASSFENPRCKGNLLELLKTSEAIKNYPRKTSIVLENILNQTVDVPNAPHTNAPLSHDATSYTIVMFWNTFSGNPNHKKAYSDLHHAIQNCPKGMFRLILINQDFHPGSVPTIQFK